MDNYYINNVFYKIIKGDLPCTKVYEDESILAFYDHNPAAPIHVLVVPKEQFTSFNDFIKHSKDISKIFKVTQHIAELLGLEKHGYRVLTNVGKNAGQEVPHFHLHILGGTTLGKIG